MADVDTYVHLVYGLSKDWCASGLRVGLLYSRNASLLKVRGKCICMHACMGRGQVTCSGGGGR